MSAPDFDEELSASDPRLVELQQALARARRQLAKRDLDRAELVETVYRAAKDAALATPPIPASPKPDKKPSKRSHVAILHTTDWQCGKRTVDFDSEILGKRLARMTDITSQLVERHASPVSHCVLLLGGDMVEGVNLFPTQAWEVDSGLYDQVFRVVGYVRQVVDACLAMFRTVHVVEEWGNHGRIGRFGELPSVDNIDRMAYRMAAERYHGEQRVTWQRSDDFMQVFGVGKYRAALLHGDEFARTFSAQRVVSKLTAWQTQYRFHDAYLGHFHRRDCYGLPAGGAAYLTGSPESSNAYAAEVLAARGRPSQRLHFVDPEWGLVMSEHVLWVDQ